MRSELTKRTIAILALFACISLSHADPAPGTFGTKVLTYHLGAGDVDDPNDLPWSHLTHLSYFGLSAQSDASLRSWDNCCYCDFVHHPEDCVPCWTDAKFQELAAVGRMHDVKVGVTLKAVDTDCPLNCNLGAGCSPSPGPPTTTCSIHSCADPSASNYDAYQCRIRAFLQDDNSRQTLAENVLARVQAADADGVDVDVEWPWPEDADNYLQFVTTLTLAMHDWKPGSYVFVAVPAWDYPGLLNCNPNFYKDLADASDGLEIMGYGYHGSFSDPGPVGPTHAGTKWPAPYNYDLAWTLGFYQSKNIPPSKLLLGFAFGGTDWPTDTQAVPAGSWNTTRQIRGILTKDPSGPFGDCETRLSSSSRVWDPVSETPYVVTPAAEGGYRQLFCESTDSMVAKLQLATDAAVSGVFFWAENFIPPDYPFWKLIDQYSMDTPWPNQAPVVSVTPHGPVARNTPLTMTGTASDPDGDTRILQWNIPSGPPGPAPSYAPGNTPSLMTSLPTSGYYTFTFSATDGAATTIASTRVLVQGDTTVPTVKLGSVPSAVSGNVTVTATASDNVGIQRVDFLIDGSVAYTDTAPPYSFVWNTNSYPDGNHTVQARATDWSDRIKTSSTVTTNVDNNGPALAILSPADGASVTGNVPISLSVSDQAGISKVEIYLNSVLKKSLTRSPWTWTWSSGSYVNQTVVILVKAYDKRSHTSTASVTVTVH